MPAAPARTPARAPAAPRPGARTPAPDELVLNRISSTAVKAATGKTWEQWLTALDKAGAHDLDHKAIVRFLAQNSAIGPWWQQMVTVGYEIARGHRAPHQRPTGFEISASRTISTSQARIFDAFHDPALRAAWLPEPIEIRTATRPRSLRITFSPDRAPTTLGVDIYPKPGNRASVTVNHGRLTSAAAGQRMKRFWSQRLDALREMLAPA